METLYDEFCAERGIPREVLDHAETLHRAFDRWLFVRLSGDGCLYPSDPQEAREAMALAKVMLAQAQKNADEVFEAQMKKREAAAL